MSADLARHWAYAAADQALAPVREWFESNWSLKEPDFDALARLIYTTEELSDGE